MLDLSPPAPDPLRQALHDIVLHPIRTLVPPWSWKAALLSAVLRGLLFFLTNLKSGHQRALDAMTVEALFAVVAAGLVGAVSQRLRGSEPVLPTLLIVSLAMPAVTVAAQLLVHHLARTPHIGAGVIASFAFAAVSSAFSWYAMRHGAILGGHIATTFRHDVTALPRIALNFALVAPRLLFDPSQRSS